MLGFELKTGKLTSESTTLHGVAYAIGSWKAAFFAKKVKLYVFLDGVNHKVSRDDPNRCRFWFGFYTSQQQDFEELCLLARKHFGKEGQRFVQQANNYISPQQCAQPYLSEVYEDRHKPEYYLGRWDRDAQGRKADVPAGALFLLGLAHQALVNP